jgi:maleylacetate reductase
MIAVPSTLSGGEYNAGCVVTDRDRKLKQTFYHPHMMPVTIILDPELGLHAPETVWLGSGARAMDHTIEALCAKNGSPLADASVLRGLALMARALPQSRNNPDDVAVKAQCQIATWLCAFGLQARVPMGASHAIGHVLGGSCGVAHYLCTSVMMPAVLRYNEPATRAAQKDLSTALGRPELPASEAFRQFVTELGLPTRLKEVAVTEDRFDSIAQTVMAEEMFIYTNPRPINNWEQVRDILMLAA